ncbi:MAG: hypothetical protein ACKOAY_12895, partial [Haliscomenobacter sp.]
METGHAQHNEEILSLANSLRWDLGVDLHDAVIESVYEDASHIARKVVQVDEEGASYRFELKL